MWPVIFTTAVATVVGHFVKRYMEEKYPAKTPQPVIIKRTEEDDTAAQAIGLDTLLEKTGPQRRLSEYTGGGGSSSGGGSSDDW